jgi:hypothetical protein
MARSLSSLRSSVVRFRRCQLSMMLHRARDITFGMYVVEAARD